MTAHGSAARERADRILRLVDRGGIGGALRKQEAPVDLAVLTLLKREVERLVRVDARRALRIATAMERLIPLVPDPKARAIATRAKAEALLFLGRYQKALDTYEETARLYAEGGDVLEGARASIAEIPTLAYLARYDEALRVARRVEGILRRHGERTYLGRLYMNKGSLYFHMDRYREALESYGMARRFLGAVSGRDETVVGLEINEGVIRTQLDEMKEAEEILDAATSRARKMGWRLLAGQGDLDLATVYTLSSRYQEALAALMRAAEVFQTTDKSLAAITEATRAEVYLRLNMRAEAVEAALPAYAHFRREGMRYDEGLALYTLGIALASSGRETEGARRLLAARRSFERDGNRVRTAVIDLHLARIHARAGDWPEARRRARQSVANFAAAGLPARAAAAAVGRAEVELLAGRPAAARSILDDVPPPGDRLARFEKTFLTGRIEEAQGRTGAALAAYRRAADLSDSVRLSLAGEEHKIAIEGYRAEVAERAVSMLLRDASAASGAPARAERSIARGARGTRSRRPAVDPIAAQAFAFVEGAKARALGDLLADLPTRSAGRRRDRGNARAARLEEATRSLAWYSAKLEREDLAGAGATAARTRLAREVARREREIEAIHRRLPEAAPARASSSWDRPASSRVSLESACRFLDPDEVVVEYFGAGGNLHAFRIDRRGACVVSLPLGTRDVGRLVARFQFEIDTMRLAGPSLAAHAKTLVESAALRLRELHAALVAPLGEIPADARLTVIPHGPLHGIPFGALEGPDGPLLARARVAWAPSVGILARLRARRPSTRRLHLVGGHADPRAPEIGLEIEAVGRALAGRRLALRPSLSSDEFFRLAPSARLIHLATHGRFHRQNPLFSAVRLADRWAHLYEILNLDLDADLVVLSGCETGAGRRTAGEEILGLARGFLARGARRLVVSLWPVEDASAGRLAALFHERHAGGLDAAEALRRASLAVRAELPHPYHWSPFVLVGPNTCGDGSVL